MGFVRQLLVEDFKAVNGGGKDGALVNRAYVDENAGLLVGVARAPLPIRTP